jgi:hypothetical protein
LTDVNVALLRFALEQPDRHTRGREFVDLLRSFEACLQSGVLTGVREQNREKSGVVAPGFPRFRGLFEGDSNVTASGGGDVGRLLVDARMGWCDEQPGFTC